MMMGAPPFSRCLREGGGFDFFRFSIPERAGPRAPPAMIFQYTQPSHAEGKTTVNWYDYIPCFFAGMFLANAVPHFVHGISGDRFPTPFAHPRSKGLSSPTVNVVWALLNLVAGYILFRVGRVSSGGVLGLGIFFAGIVAISTMLSVRFAKKQAQ